LGKKQDTKKGIFVLIFKKKISLRASGNQLPEMGNALSKKPEQYV